MPVEIGKIDRELKKLWDQADGAMTRASLINLAVYSEAPDSLGKNTALISEITEDHACRAIVVAAEPAAPESEVQAWISAHCHVSRAGSKQICSEQLSFSLKGESHRAAAEHRFRAARFRSAAESLVAGGIQGADGSAALGLGRSGDLRQPTAGAISMRR